MNLFNSVKMTKPKSNVFDLSHDVKMSLNMGELYPTLCMEVVPGDAFTIGCESLLRFAPLVSPLMHKIDVYMHYFFVPWRLIWEQSEAFVTGNDTDGNNGGVVPTSMPYINLTSTLTDAQKKVLSYWGFPQNQTFADSPNETPINAMPFYAYNRIYNEYYRDQNLSTLINQDAYEGNNTADIASLLTLRKRAWEHDYFTASLPWAQKGNPVQIPLGDVVLKNPWDLANAHPSFVAPDGDPDNGALAQAANLLDPTLSNVTIGGTPKYAYDPAGTLTVSSTTINDLRYAFRLQEWLEKNARGGTRYIENILVHFGVESKDARLQRPEYITGTKSPVSISEVLNTTGTEDLPQGNMAGHAVSVTSGRYGKYYATEHGYIIGIMSVRPKTAYYQGIPKLFTKIDDRYEIYWPTFANIGEQAVLYKEIYATHGTPNGTFGFVPRYSEYKYMPSRVAGDFQTTLASWHLGRELTNTVALNQEFIECTPRTNIFAVTDEDVDHLYAHVYHKIRAVRLMPKYGNPSF